MSSVFGLYFSVYAEGPYDERYVQIFNPTNKDVSLDQYGIINQINGGSFHFDPFISGHVIPKYSSYTIADHQSSTEVQSSADAISSSLHFDGNDAIFLVKGTASDYTIVDVIGQVDEYQPLGWSVGGVSLATRDKVLIRKPNVIHGSQSWPVSSGTNTVDSQWVVIELLNIFPNFKAHIIDHVAYWLALGQTVLLEPEAVVGGDPYVVTSSGLLYKMDNSSTAMRICQGYVGRKLLTVNGELRRDSYSMEEQMNLYMKANGTVPLASKRSVYNQSFITKVAIQFGNDSVIIDIPNRKVIHNSLDNLVIDYPDVLSSSLPMYDNVLCDYCVSVNTGKVQILVKAFVNPQIRSEVTLAGTCYLSKSNGVTTKPLSIKKCRVKNLKSTNRVKDDKESKLTRRIEEEYYYDAKNKRTFTIPCL